MKQYLLLFALFLLMQSSKGQDGIYVKDTTRAKNCFDEYYEAFTTRGATQVQDGEHLVVFSARKDTTCFCGEGKISVKGGRIVPSFMVKKEDGTFEPAKKTLHPNTLKGDGNYPTKMEVFEGMSSSFLTDDYFIINLFFIDNLKRKVVPNAKAPSPDDISGIQIQISEREKAIIQKAYDGLVFENGKSVIKPSSYQHLNGLAFMLSEKPEYKLKIMGYTDNVGSVESNLKLSMDRALAVQNYLIKKGVDASRLTANGFGVEKPIADNTTAEGRAKNRRVEFIIVN